MKKHLIVVGLVIVFLILLIIQFIIPILFTAISNFSLLIIGLYIYVLVIDFITKTSNTLKLKIFLSIIISFLIFFLIVLFWLLLKPTGQDIGLFFQIYIFLPTIIFWFISSMIGIIQSIKKRNINTIDYSLKLHSLILFIISCILLFIFFFNLILIQIAVLLGSKELCNSFSSLIDNYDVKSSCLLEVAKSNKDENICKEINDYVYKNKCYYSLTVIKKDIKICFDSPQPFDMSVRCASAFRKLEKEIYDILINPFHLDIIYALKALPSIGVKEKYIPLIKNILLKGSFNAKKESFEILYNANGGISGNKQFLENEILPLIENKPELKEYVDRINRIINNEWKEVLPSDSGPIR